MASSKLRSSYYTRVAFSRIVTAGLLHIVDKHFFAYYILGIGRREGEAVGPEKILSGWTPDTLARRIAEGEELLVEFRVEPKWMREAVRVELGRKRELLGILRGGLTGFH